MRCDPWHSNPHDGAKRARPAHPGRPAADSLRAGVLVRIPVHRGRTAAEHPAHAHPDRSAGAHELRGQALSGASTGLAINIPKTILNATMATADPVGKPMPFLAESLPQLDTDSWRLFPDGIMETTYRLKPNLAWHDGHPLAADDFVFGWQVYATAEYGVATSVPIRQITAVLAPDQRTLVIQWNQPYADAILLGSGSNAPHDGLPPLPRHLLEQKHRESIEAGSASPSFLPNSPFWSADYVGAGPYKLDSFIPGVSVEASAFDGHVLGRPRIDRVSVRGIPDVNTALATILAGEAHMSFDHFRGETGVFLERDWGTTGGTILWEPTQSRALDMQFRPERAQPLELSTDVRVRRAIAHAIDKQPIFDAVAFGRGLISDTYTPPSMDIYPLVEREVAKYPPDPRRAQQLLEEASFTRGGDGKWATPRGTPFDLPIWYTAGATNFQQENAIIVDQLNRQGIAATSNPFNTQSQSSMERALLPGIIGASGGYETGFLGLHSRLIPTAENRWVGGNRGAYSNPELDRLADAFEVALQPAERLQLTIQLEELVKENLPSIFLYLDARPFAHVGSLKGPVNRFNSFAALVGRNIHEWYWEA
jgi:peptide/nickel transport system substrate-binding protein